MLEATHKDKQKVADFYLHHPVEGHDIGNVYVIYNRTFNVSFEARLEMLQEGSGNAALEPKWQNLSYPEFRRKTYDIFEKLAMPYTDPEYPNVKLLPAWHGTRRDYLDNIFRAGYINLATTDSGYFGKGYYSSWEAEYAYRCYSSIHSDGILILNWVASFSALPVIGGDLPLDSKSRPLELRNQEGDKCLLVGKANYGNYDAHFVPVGNVDNPKGPVYDPCRPDLDHDDHLYTEIVVFEASACLPRYLVELQPTLLRPPVTEEDSVQLSAKNAIVSTVFKKDNTQNDDLLDYGNNPYAFWPSASKSLISSSVKKLENENKEEVKNIIFMGPVSRKF